MMSLTEQGILARFDNIEALKKLCHFLVNRLATLDETSALASFAASNINEQLALDLLHDMFSDPGGRDARFVTQAQYVREATGGMLEDSAP
ncbi:MAG: hypothetical protein JSU63_07305 [Phycisphaerales bacterium]|nr:MAG: hypothetical protein JSU63_07305 [Phycisphaerales bacterium]